MVCRREYLELYDASNALKDENVALDDDVSAFLAELDEDDATMSEYYQGRQDMELMDDEAFLDDV